MDGLPKDAAPPRVAPGAPRPDAAPSPEGEPDEELMRRYAAGDCRAFDALFARHAARVHAFFLRHGADPARADDLLQITWLHVHRARASFDPTARFTAWLYTIANNARRDERRRSGRDRSDLTREGALPEAPPAPGLDREEARRVRSALLSIAEGYREVIVLHRFHDLSFAEIAAMLGATEGAVKLRAHRGYLALREALGGAEGEP